VEKRDSAIYKTPLGDESVLHTFTAFPQQSATILAIRRCPAVTPPVGNTTKVISIYTSTGFGSITVPEYAVATDVLRPDIAVAPADLLHTSQAPSAKRQLRMADRSEAWLDEYLEGLGVDQISGEGHNDIPVFASVLPVEHGIQWSYLRHLSEDILHQLSGLAVYDVNILPDLASYEFAALPRLSLDPPHTPQEVLRQVALGIDLCYVPFVNNMSDAGVALSFTFPPPETDRPLPLGINMWSPEHKTSVTPIIEGCQCYTCTKHHRAFVNHLLNAKEMLGWNLLQIHNHHMMTQFFTGIRDALASNPSGLEELSLKFSAAYELELPAGTGERPRARGYHFKSEMGQEKFNKPAWQDLSRASVAADLAVETPVVPIEDGHALAKKGFAEQQN
jgi:queuine tRNA-ribosyltransferase accessory subunit